jgi:hypothetical protein
MRNKVISTTFYEDLCYNVYGIALNIGYKQLTLDIC